MKNFCWQQKGIWGDRSCAELSRYSHCRDCEVFSREGRTLFNREPPQNYLSDWLSQIAQEQETISRDEKAVHVFRLSSEWLALPAHCWVEVVGMRPVRHIPHRSGRILLGLVSVRGEIHLCVSLSNLLGIEEDDVADETESHGASKRLCMVKGNNVSWIFPADEVRGLISFSEKDATALPSTVDKSYQKFTRGLLNVEGKKIGLLDEISVFDAFSRNVG